MAKKKKASSNKDISSLIEPLNKNQTILMNALRTSEMVISSGPAGVGKTFLVASMAALMLQNKAVKRIILTRPVIPTGRSIGYFPGDLMEKMAPWVVPFMEVFKKHMDQGELDCAIKNGNIEIVPFETMRGRSFDDSFIILDEAQNTTTHEMKMFLTRTGQYSKTVVLGDVQQSDLHWLENGQETGLDIAIRLAKNVVNIPVVEFTSDDIVRSGLCKDWVKAFESEYRQAKPEGEDSLPDFLYKT